MSKALAEPPPRRREAVVGGERYHTYAFCRLLQDQSITRIFADPHEALALAELSLEVARLVPVADATPALIADLKARSWARVANVRRVLGDFPGAETALGEARMWLAQGTADPVEDAELLEFEGVLRLAQRRFGEAEAKLQRAIHLHRRIGDRHAEGRAVGMVAVLKNIAGDPQESIKLLHDALSLLDATRDPRLVVNAHHNLAVALANVGEAEESLKEIASVRSLYDPVKDRVSLLRLRQLEARARHSLRESEAAIQGYASVLKEFADLEMPLEVAYASLELALVHLDLGALEAAQRLATETLAICRGLGIEREALGALLVIEEAAQRKALTHELLNEVRSYLQQARQNPGLKFRG